MMIIEYEKNWKKKSHLDYCFDDGELPIACIIGKTGNVIAICYHSKILTWTMMKVPGM